MSIEVYGFGSTEIIPETNGGRVRNIISEFDVARSISSPSLRGKSSHISYINPTMYNPLKAHGIDSYFEESKKICWEPPNEML